MAYGKSLEMRNIHAQTELAPIFLHPLGHANRHERRKAAKLARMSK